MSIEKYISPYILSQFPRLYREEGPAFIQFVKLYYEWMEQNEGVLYDARRLQEYRDIDTTTEEFLSHFKDKYMAGLPEGALGDKRTLQKHIKEIYSSKGTAQGLELLFRLLYNESSDVYLPGDDILRPSDGVWIQPIYLEVSVNPYNVLLIGEKITGRESGATAIVEDFQVRYINKRKINVLFLSNLRGNFKTDEILLSSVIEDPLKSPSVVGSMSEILVNESGFGFKIGDVLEVGGGSGLLGKAVVSSVSPRNGAVSFTIQHGGSGYPNNNVWAPNVITVTPVDMDNPGIGAHFEIGEIANTEVITTAVDIITPYANTQLNSPDYQFPTNVGAENINTPLNQALNVQNITVGSIKSLRAINPGAGYNGPVVVTVENPVIAGLMIEDATNGNYKGNNAIVDGKAAAGNGAIDTVKIINAGIGYANGDIVTLENANVPFIAGGTVILRKQGQGEGYWKDTRSFLDSDKYIQDSFYYQEYSYETRLSVAFSYYSDLLKKLWHPAGTQGFGKVVISNVVDSLSDSVVVDIIATRITEYMTQFSTFVLTTGATSTQFITQYATQYPTTRATETSRTTSADYLINEPNLIINGAFNFNTDSWSARGDTNMAWSNGTLSIQRGTTEGSVNQLVSTSNGNTYQIDLQILNSNATSVTVYACKSNSLANSEVLGSATYTGVANTAQLTFNGSGSNTYVIVQVNGTASASRAEIDNVQLRNVPTLSQLTEFVTLFARDTSVNNGTRQTIYNTSTTYGTVYNTAFLTVFNAFPTHATSYLTQVLTGSQVATNRITNRATSTQYDTVFDTALETTRATATSRTTVYATNRQTATAYDTIFDTTFATNRATTTAYDTIYDTVFGTNRATTTTFNTTYGTTYATNRATTTAFNTNRATLTVFDTSRATNTVRSTNRATTTQVAASRSTSRATGTSRISNYATTYATVYNTEFATIFFTWRATSSAGETFETQVEWARNTTVATSKQTSRQTSATVNFNTTTTYVTSFVSNASTTTVFDTNFNTTTTFATNFNTTTVFGTNRATDTVFDTTGQTTISTNRDTTTAYDTNFSTARLTNRVTTTVYDTSQSTSFATTRNTATVFDTNLLTTFDTNTLYTTLFATNRLTNRLTDTIYQTDFLTGTIKLTDVETVKQTATSVPTVVTTLTNRITTQITNRPTLTNRITQLSTTIATAVSRDTSRTTVFVAYPTTFITSYLTGTNILTDYQTHRETVLLTDTTYDTEYPTERLTAVLTQTDVAD